MLGTSVIVTEGSNSTHLGHKTGKQEAVPLGSEEPFVLATF